jgi:hypothetical protein
MEWDCAICGGSAATIRDCKYCTGVYCSDHALPEKHNCPGASGTARPRRDTHVLWWNQGRATVRRREGRIGKRRGPGPEPERGRR